MVVHPMCGRLPVHLRCFPHQATAATTAGIATPPRKYWSSPRPLYTYLARQPALVLARGSRLFSSSSSIMTAQKIDGTAIAKAIRERLGAKIKDRQAQNPRYRPSLKIIQGERIFCQPWACPACVQSQC